MTAKYVFATRARGHDKTNLSEFGSLSLPAVSCKKTVTCHRHIINPLLTKAKLVRYVVEVHKQASKDLGQHPVILTSHLLKNAYLIHSKLQTQIKFCSSNDHHKNPSLALKKDHIHAFLQEYTL